MTAMTLSEARRMKALKLSVQAPRCPLRYWPAIVHGPEGGYLVVSAGFAAANDLTEAR